MAGLIEVSWVSPFDGQPRSQEMTTAQAAEWWDRASYPVRCTARFREVS